MKPLMSSTQPTLLSSASRTLLPPHLSSLVAGTPPVCFRIAVLVQVQLGIIGSLQAQEASRWFSNRTFSWLHPLHYLLCLAVSLPCDWIRIQLQGQGGPWSRNGAEY